jgi:hypothetical protein
MAFNWQCPHCSITQAVTDPKRDTSRYSIGLEGQAEGSLILQRIAIGCSNPACLKTTIHVEIGPGRYRTNMGYSFDDNSEKLFSQFLIPQGSSKPQPEYIPSVIREDYHEACLIRNLSPKASATLTRRCLQGMIRDFAKITKGRLIDEIDALREAVANGTADRAVSPETVEAIDHVRGVGNIGAHMEKDIDLIVPVDPGEAQALIELVEMLFEEWYGARERRKQKLARIENIAVAKDQLKIELKAQKTPPTPDNESGESAG